MRNIFKGKTHCALLIIRIIIGVIFVAHGMQKFNMGMDAVTGFFESMNIPAAGLMAWVVTLLETFGGIALILGVAVEGVSALLTIVMVIAYISTQGSIPFVGGTELNLALIAALIPLLTQGAGKYSIVQVIRAMKPLPPQPQF